MAKNNQEEDFIKLVLGLLVFSALIVIMVMVSEANNNIQEISNTINGPPFVEANFSYKNFTKTTITRGEALNEYCKMKYNKTSVYINGYCYYN
jgi:hypothetical protein